MGMASVISSRVIRFLSIFLLILTTGCATVNNPSINIKLIEAHIGFIQQYDEAYYQLKTKVKEIKYSFIWRGERIPEEQFDKVYDAKDVAYVLYYAANHFLAEGQITKYLEYINAALKELEKAYLLAQLIDKSI